MDKAKIDEAKAKLSSVWDAVLPKVKSVMFEIKTNFRADEGMTGVPKVRSMFVNLWKSGNVGKSTLMAAIVVIVLFLPLVFGTSKVSKCIQAERELDEIALQICELHDLLEKEGSLGPWVVGRDLKDEKTYEKQMEEFREGSSKELDAFLTIKENWLKICKDELKERKSECKRKGIEIDDVSPLRVAKNFLLCLREKDINGMKKLFSGNSDEKESAIKHILSIVEKAKDGSVEKLDSLKTVGRTYFNQKRDKAGVAIENELNAEQLITGSSNCTCLRMFKTSDGWFIDVEKPFCTSGQISNPLL